MLKWDKVVWRMIYKLNKKHFYQYFMDYDGSLSKKIIQSWNEGWENMEGFLFQIF